MTRRKALVGFCLLAALSAVCTAAPGAAAVTGTTVFTCQKTGKGEFTGPHCGPPEGGSGDYQPVTVKEKTTTELFANSPAAWKLKSSVGGVVIEFRIKEVLLNGSIENVVVAGEHTANGFGKFFFQEASVLKPLEEGCVISEDVVGGKEGRFESGTIQYTTAQQGDAVLFKRPAATDEVLATFDVLGCANKALNGTYKLTGSVTTTSVAGATLNFTHAGTTAQKTLQLSGAAAGIEGGLTVNGKDPKDMTFSPLSYTTVGT